MNDSKSQFVWSIIYLFARFASFSAFARHIHNTQTIEEKCTTEWKSWKWKKKCAAAIGRRRRQHSDSLFSASERRSCHSSNSKRLFSFRFSFLLLIFKVKYTNIRFGVRVWPISEMVVFVVYRLPNVTHKRVRAKAEIFCWLFGGDTRSQSHSRGTQTQSISQAIKPFELYMWNAVLSAVALDAVPNTRVEQRIERSRQY